jgi:hypothetical protein
MFFFRRTASCMKLLRIALWVKLQKTHWEEHGKRELRLASPSSPRPIKRVPLVVGAGEANVVVCGGTKAAQWQRGGEETMAWGTERRYQGVRSREEEEYKSWGKKTKKRKEGCGMVVVRYELWAMKVVIVRYVLWKCYKLLFEITIKHTLSLSKSVKCLSISTNLKNRKLKAKNRI